MKLLLFSSCGYKCANDKELSMVQLHKPQSRTSSFLELNNHQLWWDWADDFLLLLWVICEIIWNPTVWYFVRNLLGSVVSWSSPSYGSSRGRNIILPHCYWFWTPRWRTRFTWSLEASDARACWGEFGKSNSAKAYSDLELNWNFFLSWVNSKKILMK